MKRRTVSFAPEAVEDLDAIYDWTALSTSENVALAFVGRIERYCLGFDIAAERGRLIRDSRDGLRYVGYDRQATILFRVRGDRVTIVRIFRAGLDWWSIAFD